MIPRAASLARVVVALAGCLAGGAVHAGDAPTATKTAPVVTPALKVAGAADLALAFKEVGQAYEKKTGQRVDLTLGSTGLLARQLEEGAPFDVFAAANVSFVDKVVKAGVCDAATKAPYAQGRLVLWSSSEVGPPPADLKALLDKKVVKIGIANPEHAPYGKAAQEALTRAGLWEQLKPKIVYGENIQQTLQFAQSGNTEVSIVALSLGLFAPKGAYTPVDPSLHAPIDQALVVCGKDAARAAAARQLALYVNSEEGRAIMKRFGFTLPGETVTAAK